MAGEGAAARAEGLGVPAQKIDGNDILGVIGTTRETIARIRSGNGPELIQTMTYRQTGHTATDPAAYRPDGEADKMIASTDPIDRLRETLKLAGVEDVELKTIHDQAQNEMVKALADATASPWPKVETVFDDVQDVGSPAQEAF